ncbi:unnamed protein product, partial [Prorocentrum cordatum]
GRMLGPLGIHAGMALMEGIQEFVSEWQEADPTTVAASIDRTMDTLNDFLTLADDSTERGQAVVTETIKMCKVSESYMVPNSKNRLASTGPPASGGLPNDAKEEAVAKLGQFSGRNLSIAVGVLIVFVRGEKSLSAAP